MIEYDHAFFLSLCLCLSGALAFATTFYDALDIGMAGLLLAVFFANEVALELIYLARATKEMEDDHTN